MCIVNINIYNYKFRYELIRVNKSQELDTTHNTQLVFRSSFIKFKIKNSLFN